MIEKKTIYFAHPFDKWRTKREEMIEKILEERGFVVINPFKEEDKLNEKYGVDNYYENPTEPFALDIVNKDWLAVSKCDAYFGWFPKDITMIGTSIELVWALLLGKETITLSYKPHPFLWMFSNKFYTNYSKFVSDEPFSVKEHRWDILNMITKHYWELPDMLGGIND